EEGNGWRALQVALAYERSVQNAFGEAENALVRLEADRRRVALLTEGELTLQNPKLAAGIVVILVCSRLRNPWLPFIAGMAVLLLLRKGFGL
ncbi:MAG TPA: AzlD domain-containing protein, partial [Pseudothauera hydrothermalis]|nr:AzlD domain-containing protein [Pseudothauera hydrothermalis]